MCAAFKARVRRLLGSRWTTLVRLKGTRPVRTLLALPGYPTRRLNHARNYPFLAVTISGTMGMGGLLIHVLRLLKHAEAEGLTPVIRANNPLYSEGPEEDILEKYCGAHAPSPMTSARLRFIQIENEEHYIGLNVRREMSMDEARATFNKYIKMSDVINDNVSRYIRVNGGDFDLAIHYRGTDKSYEAPLVSFERVFSACQRILDKCSSKTVFLATDSPAFGKAIKVAFPTINFSSFEFAIELEPESPRHFSSLKPSEKAIEALVNMVLLSRCQYLIRTSSYLSAMSCIMNKEVKVVTLGNLEKHYLFPERQIHEEASRGDIDLRPLAL
jgi:hypothetical protein